MIVKPNGLGISADAQTTGLITSGVSIAGGLAASTSVFGLLAAGSAVVPFIGPIVAGATLLIGYLLRDPNGPLKVATTNIVNQIEPYCKQNLAAAQQQAAANGGCLTSQEKATLVGNYDQMWQAVVNKCSNPQFKEPGQNCINDRNRGGKWDWFSYYRDPIVAMPTCQDAVSTASGLVASLTSGLTSGGSSSLLLYGGLGLIGLFLAMKE